MKIKKIIIPVVISLVLLGLCLLIYKLVDNDKKKDDQDKKAFTLTSDEIVFTEYDRISYGKYYFLFDGANTSVIDGNGKVIENYTSDNVIMIRYFGKKAYSDYYYILSDTFILKKDGQEIATIKYDTLDFDLRKSSVTVELLNDESLLLTYKTKENIPSKEDSSKNVSVDVSYAYVYNFNTKTLYPKIVSYGGIGKFNNNEGTYFLLKDLNNNYEIYSLDKHNTILNNYYPKVGNMNIALNESKSKSTKYVYVCSKVNEGIYSSCGLLDYEGKSKITLKYDDELILDYNDEYYVLKKDMYVYLYDYINVAKLSDFDYIMLSSKYIITFKDEVMDIYDYELKKLKSVDMGIQEIVTKDSAGKSKNIELIDEGDSIIINVYDNVSIDEGKLESAEKVKSYIYSPEFKDKIEERRLYSVYDSNDNLIMYYSPEYSGKSILKVYLYSVKIEAFRVINLDSNSGKFEILDKCSDLSVGYLLDGNYTIFNPKFESAGTQYTNEIDYNNAICNNVGNYTVANTVLYDKTSQKIAFNQIKVLNKIDNANYLIIHDNKVGIFK